LSTLGRSLPTPFRGDELDIAFFVQLGLQLGAVEGLVSNHLRGQLGDQCIVEGFVDEYDVMPGAVGYADSERQSVAVGQGHYLRCFACATPPDEIATTFCRDVRAVDE